MKNSKRGIARDAVKKKSTRLSTTVKRSAAAASKSGSAAKGKKPVAVPKGRLTSERKKITLRATKKTITVYKSARKFVRSSRQPVKGKRRLIKTYKSKAAPDFREFYKKNKKRGDQFIFRIGMQHNFEGKRIKSGFSTKRVKISNQKELERVITNLQNKFVKAMKKYLKRKDLTSLTFQGVTMEVSEREKTAKRKKS